MPARPSKNNLTAGFFLLGCLFAGVLITIWISEVGDQLLTRRSAYVFRFKVADGAAGLKKESVVKIGGQQVGGVTAVSFFDPRPKKERGEEPAPAASTGGTGEADSLAAVPANSHRAEYVYVTVKLRSDLVIFSDAAVYLELPLLGSVSSINIPDVGGHPKPARVVDGKLVPPVVPKVLGEWAVLDGTLAPPTFLAQAGYGPEQSSQLRQILERGADIGQQVQELVRETRPRVGQAFETVQGSLDDVKYLTGDFRGNWPVWAKAIATTLANIRDGTGSAGEGIAEVRGVIGAVQKAIDHNRPFIDAIFLNTAELTDKINKEAYTKVLGMLGDGQRAVADVADITTRARHLISEESPNLRRMLADARLASDQLRLAMIEIRRNPWRLLYQPRRKELQEELLYDTARSYADAVSDLRSASESLDGLLAAQKAGTAPPTDQARITELTSQVQAAFAKYKSVEQKFMDLVIKGASE